MKPLFACAVLLVFSACLAPNSERHLTLLATNDLHGSIETVTTSNGSHRNGLSIFSGIVRAIKSGLAQRYGKNSAVLVLDAGDQFQGTLISNYTEGALVYASMSDLGYDAVVPGNHAYDFGPKGWLIDHVTPETSQNPREVIEGLASKAPFPLLSANTYYKSSILNLRGDAVPVQGTGCVPLEKDAIIDWTQAKRLPMVQPFVIRKMADIRIALIGIDTPDTATTTTVQNVADLCFRDEYQAYQAIRTSLEGKADIFVLIIHDGNSNNQFPVTELIKKINLENTHGVDAVIAGHTHFVNDIHVGPVPGIQSGANGELFGRIDLVYDVIQKKILTDKTQSTPGIPIDDSVRFEGIPVSLDPVISDRIALARKQINIMAQRKLGIADKTLTRDRIEESSLADALTDAFRISSHSEIAFMNTGGLRDDLKQGEVTYEDLFKVLPFNNHGLVIGPMNWKNLKTLLNRSIQTCGAYGALMQSGLKVQFSRDCALFSHGTRLDLSARLVRVETLSGEILYDFSSGQEVPATRFFEVATLDFLYAGGSGYTGFMGTPLISDQGVLRDQLADILIAQPAEWSGATDGRWTNLSSQSGH